jgi:hypothetical protein
VIRDGALGIFELLANPRTAFCEHLAELGRAQMARRSLQHPDAEPFLERGDLAGQRRRRHAEIRGRAREAASLDNAMENDEIEKLGHSCILARPN